MDAVVRNVHLSEKPSILFFFLLRRQRSHCFVCFSLPRQTAERQRANDSKFFSVRLIARGFLLTERQIRRTMRARSATIAITSEKNERERAKRKLRGG